MSTGFEPPASIEETVKEILGLKAGTAGAVRGATVMGPHIANQVAALYELAGEDPDNADALAAPVRARAARIQEHLEAIKLDLASIGGTVARAIKAKEEGDARRKVTAAKAGTRTAATPKTSTSGLSV